MKNQNVKKDFFLKLDWDTKTFGYPVYKISNFDSSNQFKEILEQIRQKKGKLVYVFLDFEDFIRNKTISENGGILVDEKITFVKNIGEEAYVKDTKIISYLGHPLNQNLIQLAFQSGEYSRFKIDKNFKSHEFEKLYKKWMENSLKKIIAKDVLVYVEGNVELGVITVGEKYGKADIAILAVDKNFRGKSIGTKLVNSAFSLTKKWGFDKIQVVTQGKNKIACRFYESLGFKIEKTENIYHFWL